MVAKKGKHLSEIYADIVAKYGQLEMIETDYGFTMERKAQLLEQIYERHDLPEFAQAVDHVSYLDGCKVYFADDSWVVIRFSGTEPLLRVFAEAATYEQAQGIIDQVVAYYQLA